FQDMAMKSMKWKQETQNDKLSAEDKKTLTQRGAMVDNMNLEEDLFIRASKGGDTKAAIDFYNNYMPPNFEITAIKPAGNQSFDITRRNGTTDRLDAQKIEQNRDLQVKLLPMLKRAGGTGLSTEDTAAKGLDTNQVMTQTRALRTEIKGTEDWAEKLSLADEHDKLSGDTKQTDLVTRQLKTKIKELETAATDTEGDKAGAAAAAQQELDNLKGLFTRRNRFEKTALDEPVRKVSTGGKARPAVTATGTPGMKGLDGAATKP